MSSSGGVARAERGQAMTKKANLVTINNPIYIPILEEDYGTIQYYENLGIPVRWIVMHGVGRYYAIMEGDSAVEAKRMTDGLCAMVRKDIRAMQKQNENETSYDALVEEGYDVAVDENDPANIVSELMLVKDLLSECEKLTEEKKRICMGIAEKKTEREMADEFGIPQMTLHDRKVKVLKELKKKLD